MLHTLRVNVECAATLVCRNFIKEALAQALDAMIVRTPHRMCVGSPRAFTQSLSTCVNGCACATYQKYRCFSLDNSKGPIV